MLIGLAAAALGADLDATSQVLLCLKVASYDRNTTRDADGTFTVGVVHLATDRNATSEARDLADAIEAASARVRVGGRPIRAMILPWSTKVDLADRSREADVDLLYVGRGMQGSVADVLEVTRSDGILSITADLDVAEAGVTVGLHRAYGRTVMRVRRASAEAEQADFAAGFLAVAEVLP